MTRRTLARLSIAFLGVAMAGGVFIAGIHAFKNAGASSIRAGEIVIEPRWEGAVAASTTVRLSAHRWVAYAPTNFDPIVSPPAVPTDASIRADLAVLRRAGFDGLVTYGAEFPSLPALAREQGFRAILLGVWDPASEAELTAATAAARHEIVVGLIVGNEGLTFQRYDLPTLRHAMDRLRRETKRPVSTTEVVELFMTRRELMEWSDFLAPNAHPYHHGLRDPAAAADWTLQVFRALTARAGGKPVLLKEVGLPTAGDDHVNEANQASYYDILESTDVRFVFFEAFDGPWKRWAAVEPHWGLFRADRSPKVIARRLSERARRGASRP